MASTNNIPPPPSGFTQLGGAPPDDNIPPPPSGFTQLGGAPTAPPQQPSQPAAATPPPNPAQLVPFPEQVRRATEQTKGFIKGGMQTLAGLIDAANTPVAGMPGMNPLTASGPVPAITRLTDWIKAHSVINNPEQEIGNFVESAHEFLPLMAEEAPTAVANYARQADLAKFAKDYPKIAAVWNSAIGNVARTAVRAGAEQGTQVGLKTEDPEKTKEAAETGAETGAGAEALGAVLPTMYSTGSLVRKAGNYISDTIEGMRPGTRTVAGADFATQPNAPENPVLRNLKDVVQDPATQAVDQALGSIAKTGVANSVNRTNAMRAPEAQIIPPSRQLPGRAGFEIGPAAEPTAVREGSSARPPNMRVQHVGTRAVEKPEGTYDPTVAGASSRREPIMAVRQYADSSPAEGTAPTWVATGGSPPEGAEGPEEYGGGRRAIRGTQPTPPPVSETASGPGTLILTDDGQGMSVERARQQVAQYDRILNDPDEAGNLGARQRAAIESQREDIAGQLNRFDNFAAAQPHFPLHDPLEMVRNTDSLGDASEQLEAAHAPFWQAADDVSGKQWTNLREKEKFLRKQLGSSNPIRNYDDLQQELDQNQADQMAFFDRYKTTVAPHDWERARNGYQDGIVLGNLNDFLQQRFNGISRELEQRGIASGNKRQRVFQPGEDFNKSLENFYSKGMGDRETNREVLQRTIGQDHMDALHDLGIMFNSSERMEQSQSLMQNIGTNMKRHYHGMKGLLATGSPTAAMAGYMAGGATGAVSGAAAPLTVPLVSGGIVGTNRYIRDRLITDPDFLKAFSYAIKNKIPPRTAGPLLFARMISNWEKSNQQGGK
jgi:hypothetical protein